MSNFDRLYCTHCTFGTSVLETASADNASNVLGYSVRASSLPEAERGRLRQVFRAIERLLSYELPRDASAADKETLDAASAPRRLIFLPSLGDYQVVGQVCYRSHDTAGRPGSYFADMIVARIDPRQPDTAWSPVDCLRLWAADYKGVAKQKWWCDSEESLATRVQDGHEKPFAPAISLHELSGDGHVGHAIISDELLVSFLCHEHQSDSHDPGQVIPPRWYAIPVKYRRDFFAKLLQSTIGMLDRGRETVVLAVEPSVAALLFYGICRLLPDKLTRFARGQSGLSFSTYEAFPERPMTSLVATTFLREGADHDLPAEAYQRGFACNTFRNEFKYGRITEPQAYVSRVFDRLAPGEHSSLKSVDGLIEAINSLPRLTVRSLDTLIRIDEVVTQYVQGDQPLTAIKGVVSPAPNSDEYTFRRERFKHLIEEQDTSRTSWPPDFLETAINWFGSDLDALWAAKGSVQRVLEQQLPRGKDSEKTLEKLISGQPRLPDAAVYQAIIAVAEKQMCLPKCLAMFLKSQDSKSQVQSMKQLLAMLNGKLRQSLLKRSDLKEYGSLILAAIDDNWDSADIEDFLCSVLDDSDHTADDRWGVLVEHASLRDRLPRPLGALAYSLNRVFGGGVRSQLQSSPPRLLAGSRREEARRALTQWAELTPEHNSYKFLLHGWADFFKVLNTVLDEADQRLKKTLALTSFRGPPPACAEVARKLEAFKPGEWTPQLRGERGEILKTALKATGREPKAQDLVKRWVDSMLAAPPSPTRNRQRLGFGVAVAGVAAVAAAVCAWIFLQPENRSGKLPAPAVVVSTEPKPGASKNVIEPSENKVSPREEPRTKADSLLPTDPASKQDQAGSRGSGPSPANAPKRTGRIDAKLEIAFVHGKAIVKWDGSVVAKAKSQISLIGPGSSEIEPDTAGEADIAQMSFPTDGFGEYTAVLKVDAVTPEITKKKSFHQPSRLEVGAIRMNLQNPEQPILDVAITGNIPSVAEYCSPENAILILKAAGEETNEPFALEQPLPNDPGNKTVGFPIPIKTWTPDKLYGLEFTLTIKVAQGEGEPSVPQRIANGASEFFRKQVESRTVSGVPGVWSLESSPKPIPLHPFIRSESVEIDVLAPRFRISNARLSIAKEKNKEEWTVYGTDTAGEVACGSVAIDRKNPWQPEISYREPQAPPDKPEKLEAIIRAKDRLRASKLRVTIDGISHELQLCEPKEYPPIVMDFRTKERRCGSQELPIENFPAEVDPGELIFKCVLPKTENDTAPNQDRDQFLREFAANANQTRIKARISENGPDALEILFDGDVAAIATWSVSGKRSSNSHPLILLGAPEWAAKSSVVGDGSGIKDEWRTVQEINPKTFSQTERMFLNYVCHGMQELERTEVGKVLKSLEIKPQEAIDANTLVAKLGDEAKLSGQLADIDPKAISLCLEKAKLFARICDKAVTFFALLKESEVKCERCTLEWRVDQKSRGLTEGDSGAGRSGVVVFAVSASDPTKATSEKPLRFRPKVR